MHSKKRKENRISVNLLIIILSSAFAMILFFVSFVCLPLYLPSMFHYSESEIGYFMAFISLIAVIAASQMPKVTKRKSNLSTLGIGFLFFTVGLLSFYLTDSTIPLFMGGIGMGIGFGFTVPLLNQMTTEESNSMNMGKNLGYYSMAIFGGQFLSTFIIELSSEIKSTFLNAGILSVCIAIGLLIKSSKTNSIGDNNL